VATERAEAAEALEQVGRFMWARLARTRPLLWLKTAPLNPTSPLAAMAATAQIVLMHSMLMEVAEAVAYPAVAGASSLEVAVEVAVAPEETVAMHFLMEAMEAAQAEVAPSSMVETVDQRGAVAHTSAVAQAAAKIMMAMMPLAPAEVEVEAAQPVGEMAAVAPTAEVAVEPAPALARFRAAVVATPVLAAEVVPQGSTGHSPTVLMEGMADLAAAPASASAPLLIRTGNPEIRAVSEEVVTAVAVAAGVELSEAPSSIKAV
jgi:hypothetical protein